ncbi:hypothetical protein [Streptomyces sp. 6N223]|uniref:hypothetical protein n=1 Tax=Streptomyces sp. 6N223 TaxID=3457412 RepID=UPI003FD0284A
MRTTKQDPHAGPAGLLDAEDVDPALDPEAGTEGDAEAEGDLTRVACPDCRQPIALSAEAEALPEHALCPTRWNPFGLTVCPGSGRNVAGGAGTAPVPAEPRRGESAARLTLPEGLDWRLQPFSDPPVARPLVRQAA